MRIQSRYGTTTASSGMPGRLAHVLNTHFMYKKSQQKLMFDEELQSLSYSAYLKIALPK